MRVLLVAALLVTGCGKDTSSIDLVSESPAQQALLDPFLQEVAAGINAAVGCMAIQVNAGHYYGIPVRVLEEPLATGELGEYVFPDAINLNPRIFNAHDEAVGVTVHELGHAAGLGHTPGTIMSAVYASKWTPDAAYASLAYLLKVHGITLCRTKD